MKAVRWHGKSDVRVEDAPDPKIEDPGDVVIQITSTAICGSDLHLYNGFMPGMKAGDIIGHEPMGVVVEVGRDVRRLAKGDRVVVPFTISCGHCWFCEQTMFSLCDNSNPNAEQARKQMGHSPAGLFGFSHLLGGFPGGQAEYLRVPSADVGPIKVPEGLSDEQVLFLSDIFPTGYMAAENAEIAPGDTVAVWGCGPVGQFAIQSAWMFDAGRVIAIDRIPERLRMAETNGRAETINTDEVDVYEKLMEMTNGRGPDRCIDAVGAEAHASSSVWSAMDTMREAIHLESDKPYVLQEAIRCCRKGGTISVPGVYVGSVQLPFGAAMNKALTFRMGQTHVQRYLDPLMKKIEEGKIDPSFVITHRVPLMDAAKAYETFRDKEDECIKVVLKP
ncbi:zinc-dependent alcohol dehydrogenase [Blastopirellula marina]|uniref:Glutathione-dependent formaldehyde dehydrogenase n=1 Tax=Blastopirellula marina DSM 3645 TaxID=314230 RepID=A3ZV92_9BACT|nr:zinc-dependent alcohol dehydrogenase [Blastopirellula marina]EAQ79238.1 glutathione-dependent formaldehyde dehydrogenase [Blastopirellula marina DSM 3645]